MEVSGAGVQFCNILVAKCLRFRALNLMPELSVISKHKIKTQRARRDNHQRDDFDSTRHSVADKKKM